MARFDMGAAEMAALAPVTVDGAAYYELGVMYAAGRTTPVDLVAAHRWFNIAVALGYRPAVARRAEVAAEMSTADIASAQREARLWLANR